MKKSIKTFLSLFLILMVIIQMSPVSYALSDESSSHPTSSNTSSEEVLYIIVITLLLAILAVIIVIVWNIRKDHKTIKYLEEDVHWYQEQYETDIKNYQEESKSLAQKVVDESSKYVKLRLENKQLQKRYDDLDRTYQALKYRHEKVIQIYPSSEQEVNFIIEAEHRQRDMLTAKKADNTIQEALCLSPIEDNFEKICSARRIYLQLTPAQKSHITSDINKLEQLYGIILSLKSEQARKAAEEKNRQDAINAINAISKYMSELDSERTDDLDKLEDMQERFYSRQQPNTKRFFNWFQQKKGC